MKKKMKSSCSTETEIKISENCVPNFKDFRKELHQKLRKDYNDPEVISYINEIKGIRFPGRVEVIPENVDASKLQETKS